MDNGVDLSVDDIKVERSPNTTEEPGTSSSVESGTSASLIVKAGPSKEPEARNYDDGSVSSGRPEARNYDDGSVSSGRTTPDSSCSICLGAMVNKSFTDSCMHQFCFTCLKQWSKVKAQCPLCKQDFKAIYYNVRSIEDYQQYVLPLPPPPRPTFVMVNFPGQEENIDVYRRRMNTEAAAVRSYLDYVVSLETSMNSHTLPTPRFRSHLRRTRPITTSSFRRNIYQQGLWVQRQTDVTGRIRESSPEFYRLNPAMVHRLVPWLSRELNVLCDSNSQTVMSIILDLILRVPIRSPEFATGIAPHIGRHTEHFVHEFHSYATTPYDLIGYDRESSYTQRETLFHSLYRQYVLSTSSEDDVQEVTRSWRTPSVVPANVASDSDDCVIVDSVQAQRPRTPEVITLESDDDLQIVSTSSTSQRAHPTYLLRPKRTLLSSPAESRRRRLNVSININLPGPSHGRARSSHRHRHRYIPSPDMESSSSSDSSPNHRLSRKMPKKKQKSGLRSKYKTPVEDHERSPQKEVLDLENESSSSEEGFPCCALPLKKRRQRPDVLKSSSEESVLSINAEPDLLALLDPEVLQNKPRLRSVVVKPEVKTETLDVSDLPSSSFHDLPEVKTENKYFVKTSPSCDSDSSNTSDSSCRGSKRRFIKNRTSSKQRKNVEKH